MLKRSSAVLGIFAVMLAGCGQGLAGSSYACDTGNGLTVRFEFKSSGKLVETRTRGSVSIPREFEYREEAGRVTYGSGAQALIRGNELVLQFETGSLTCLKE